jgi:hypothetical protein
VAIKNISRLAAVLSTLCLLCITAPAQSGRRDLSSPTHQQLKQAQAELLERMSALTSVSESVASELDDRGRVVASKSFVYRPVMQDDGRLFSGNVLQRTVKLKRTRLTRWDSYARFLPKFLSGSYSLGDTYSEGGLFVTPVLRKEDGRGFVGRLWTDSAGRVLRAEGVWLPVVSDEGDRALPVVYRANPQTFLPESVTAEAVVADKNGRVVGRVRVETRFSGYKRFGAGVKVIEMGDVPEP